MCTSLVRNARRTIVGWNLDILDMEYRVTDCEDRVCIEINDKTEGWMPLFGANARGDFVAMPTCWPYDARSDPGESGAVNIIELDIALLTGARSFGDTCRLAREAGVCSLPGITFQAQLSDREGNVLRITPGQGCELLERPAYALMTNFSPFKGAGEKHPWMGLDRFRRAEEMLERSGDAFGVSDCFEILRATAQTVCPTVVSMVFDLSENTVHWCENRAWGDIRRRIMSGA